MKTIKMLFFVGSIASLTHIAPATQDQTGQDSIVQIVAESQGLARVPAGEWPETGTFWLMQPGGLSVPAPTPPQDTNTPVYLLAAGQYLVDSTAGNFFRSTRHANTQTAIAAAALVQAEAVTNLIGKAQSAAQQRARAQQLGQQQSQSATNFITGTNASYAGGLALEITNVANGLAYLNLRGATNWVYALWSTTNLFLPWQIEAEVWPWDTNSEPFTVATAGRENLFLKAEDWTEVDSNGDGVPDWWLWYWFGDLNGLATSLDFYGTSYEFDFENWLDPNIIGFSIEATNFYVSQPTATVQLNITIGHPAYYAVLVDSDRMTDFSPTNIFQRSSTNWLSLTSTNLAIALGATDGTYQVSIGLKGPAPEATETWQECTLVLNQTSLGLSITNPAVINGESTVIKPYLQLQGYANKQLASLSYDISNAAGIFTNQQCLVTGQVYDRNRLEFTTNYFQAYDLPLADNANAITLRATDRAGNTTVTNIMVWLDYSTATNPAVVNLIWPQDGMAVSGTNITIRGTMSDETGSIVAQVVNGDGTTNSISATVERNGMFWLEHVPVNGINQISIKATDAAGNMTVTNFTVNPSAMMLTIDSTPTRDNLWSPTNHVGGRISDPNASVYVNGIQATNNGNGTWSANNVPIYGLGTATFNAVAVAGSQAARSFGAGQPAGAQAGLDVEMPPKAIISHYEANQHVMQMKITSWPQWDPDSRLESDTIVTYDSTLTPDADGNWRQAYNGTVEYINQSGATGTHINGSWSQSGKNPWNLQIPSIPLFDSWGGGPTFPNIIHYFASPHHFYYDRVDGSDPNPSHFIRLYVNISAATAVKLYTGGKASVSRQNLFSLTCSLARSYTERPQYSTFSLPWRAARFPTIPMSKLRVGVAGKTPGADGIVMISLPDNAAPDITVLATGVPQHYSVTVVPKKYKPVIKANGVQLDDYGANLTACVGQKVTFSLGWISGGLSATPPNLSQIVAHWKLPGNYVNTNPDPVCLKFYTKDAAQLNQTSTSCWYVKELKEGTAKLTMNVADKSGNQQLYNVSGKFSVYRPTATFIPPSALDGTPTVMAVNGSLTLGYAHDRDMSFGYRINSGSFSGVAGYTQLVGDGGDEIQTYKNHLIIFQPDNLLDTQEFPRGTPPVFADTINTNTFWDGPHINLALNNLVETKEDLHFHTYLLFKPDAGPGPNIFVPLRKVNWELHDYATHNPDDTWTPHNSTSNGSTGYKDDADCNDFPHWKGTTPNSWMW